MANALATPHLVQLHPTEYPNLVGVAFEFMKRIPAGFCVEKAINPPTRVSLTEKGLFEAVESESHANSVGLAAERDGKTKIFMETSSGNMATGLAEVCKARGIPLYLLVPSVVDTSTRDALEELGAAVDTIDTKNQDERIRRLNTARQNFEKEGWDVWWVAQYSNPNNILSYWSLAEFLASELDQIDVLVGPVGTGGSSRGTAAYLRSSGFPDLSLVGVDACGSVNFDHEASGFLLGGLGSTRPMPLVDRKAYDVVHWIDDDTAFASCVNLFELGVPVGGSSGAAYLAARHEAARSPNKIVVVIFPDHARRYAHTIRSEEWRAKHNVDLSLASQEPTEVVSAAESDPSQPGVDPGWYRIDWRTYLESSCGVTAEEIQESRYRIPAS